MCVEDIISLTLVFFLQEILFLSLMLSFWVPRSLAQRLNHFFAVWGNDNFFFFFWASRGDGRLKRFLNLGWTSRSHVQLQRLCKLRLHLYRRLVILLDILECIALFSSATLLEWITPFLSSTSTLFVDQFCKLSFGENGRKRGELRHLWRFHLY